jgi:hypothetical protein
MAILLIFQAVMLDGLSTFSVLANKLKVAEVSSGHSLYLS